jgi:TRAP transporter 4TM/12TM fusion protein
MNAEPRPQEKQTTETSQLSLGGWRDLATPAALMALAWSLTQIAFVIWPSIDTLAQRALHVGFALSLAYLLFARGAKGRTATIVYTIIGLLTFLPALYIAWQDNYLTSERIQGLDPVRPLDYVMGLLLIIPLFEAGRRMLGLGLVIFSAIFVVYFFAGPYLPGDMAHHYSTLEQFIDAQFLSLNGIFGVPVGVSTSTVFYFILFAAIYDAYGGGRLIIDIGFALTGRAVGGPAKAAVISSGLLGTVSGSAVANVMSVGIFTIPLMRSTGYQARFAGAVEAAASTGGQLVPPVMGAAAFIMADYLQMPYQSIALAAIIPAALYYIALLVMVDLRARQRNLRRSDEIISATFSDILKTRGHLLLSLVWLVYRVISGFPVETAALESCAVTIVIGSLRASTRQGPLALIDALVVSAERTITVALPCALAGIVVAVITFTGLGTKFTGLMIWMSHGQIWLLLGFTMIAALILGTGMPTTSAYIMAAVLLAPALISMGVDRMTVHFFIFYFAILSMVTPPVALAAYAAASISRASASETGWTAFMLSFPGFLIPYSAIMHPGLLLIGDTFDAVWGVFNVLLGFVGVSAAVIGWMLQPLSTVWRIGFLILGLASLLPDLTSTLICVALTGGALAWLALRPRQQEAVRRA